MCGGAVGGGDSPSGIIWQRREGGKMRTHLQVTHGAMCC